jgi:cobalt/nickel transport system permease protein
MHISEGVLSAPVLVTGALVAAGGLAIGLKKMSNQRVPEVAVLASALFVASLIRFPIGPASVHLALNGLAGVLLGWMVFPAVFVALSLQALLFQFGGFTTLGVNTAVMAMPAMLAFIVCKPILRNSSRRSALVAGALAGGIGIAGGAILISIALIYTERSLKSISIYFLLSHIPVMIIEGVVSAFVLAFLYKVKPEVLGVNKKKEAGPT